jgi:hypothetical protein
MKLPIVELSAFSRYFQALKRLLNSARTLSRRYTETAAVNKTISVPCGRRNGELRRQSGRAEKKVNLPTVPTHQLRNQPSRQYGHFTLCWLNSSGLEPTLLLVGIGPHRVRACAVQLFRVKHHGPQYRRSVLKPSSQSLISLQSGCRSLMV